MQIQVKKIQELKGHAMGIYSISAGSALDTVFTGSADRMVAEWNIKSRLPEAFSVKLDNPVYSVKFFKSKSLLLVGTSTGNLHVIDILQKKELKNFSLHKMAIFDIMVNEANGHVITLGGDGLMAVWDSADWRLLLQLPLSVEKLRKGRFNSDCSKIALGGRDGYLRVFETEFYNEIFSVKAHEDGVNSVAWHPNGKHLISGGKDAYLRIWSVEKGFEMIKEIPAHNFAIYSIAFSPDGKFCATASRDKTIKIWDAETFDMPVRIDRKSHHGHLNSVNDLYWSDSDALLCSVGDDKSLMLWQIS